MSSFMRKLVGENREYPGPPDYDTGKSLIKKFANKRGYTLLASKCEGAPKNLSKGRIPSVGTYDLEPKKVFKNAAQPFGSNTGRTTLKDYAGTPGPSTYTTTFKPSQKICLCFGTNKFNYPSVQIVCSPINLAVCEACLKTPTGDYWRRASTNQVYCRPCMKEEMSVLKSCARKSAALLRRIAELNRFTRHRYCGFFHDHSGTSAAVQIMSKKDLKFKVRKEDYLASFGF